LHLTESNIVAPEEVLIDLIDKRHFCVVWCPDSVSLVQYLRRRASINFSRLRVVSTAGKTVSSQIDGKCTLGVSHVYVIFDLF
jgi:hypothetical protein